MRYVRLGSSGLRVSELALGTAGFGDPRLGSDPEQSARLYERFREAGGNFIDTANGYAEGRSEAILGELLQSERERVVLGTKFAMDVRPDDPNGPTNCRKNLKQSLEHSLRRLRTDYVDVYWVHVWDPHTPLVELMSGLHDLVVSGKVHYLGICNAPAWVVARANTLAELRGWTPFVALQIPYSLIQRTVERELVPMARALDMTIAAWSPLGAGILTGKYNLDPDAPGRAAGSGRVDERTLGITGVAMEIAEQLGCSAARVALSWLRGREDRIIPLLGARTVEQLEDCLACSTLSLDAAQRERLDRASAVELGFPAHFFERQRRARGEGSA